jgi:large subunit ribosomal protein L15
MELHNLRPAEGSVRKPKRIGRGEGSGHGGTSTRGNKGQQAGTGYQSKRGFEGGQMPLQRRMPKRGFINPFTVSYKIFNLEQVDALVEKYGLTEFSPEVLYMNGLINRTDLVKVLARGEMKTNIPFKIHAASEKAKLAITAAGASLELLK